MIIMPKQQKGICLYEVKNEISDNEEDSASNKSDKSKRLSYIQLRHKNIDSNCLNFIKAITQSQS